QRATEVYRTRRFQSSLHPEAECDLLRWYERDGWRVTVSILTPPRGRVRRRDRPRRGLQTRRVSILTPPRGRVRHVVEEVTLDHFGKFQSSLHPEAECDSTGAAARRNQEKAMVCANLPSRPPRTLSV